jgi:hypothetical protein
MDLQSRLEQLALSSLTDDGCPAPDQLAAYILGTLTGNEQLVVAAHVRDCPLCQQDVADCRPPQPRPRLLIARLLPLSLSEGRRSAVRPANVRRYVGADLAVDLTITPTEGDYWRISGQATRNGIGVAECRVIVRKASGRHLEQQTDHLGFFTFEALRAGRYTLTVVDGDVQIQIRGLSLDSEDT